MQRRHLLIASGSAGLFAACGGGDDDDDAPRNAFTQVNLVSSEADTATFKPTFANAELDAEFIDAWGIAIRPAGAGGHFWVTAGGWSYQFVGDVGASSDTALKTLFQDALTLVRIPGAGVPEGEANVTNTDKFIGFTTGVVFNGADLTSDKFVVRGQKVTVDGVEQTLEGSARFIFATDSGVISGWTERNATSNSVVRRNGPAVEVINGNADGHAYFGVAVKPGTWDRLWAADFGASPQLRAFDAQWQPVALGATFANPFLEAGRTAPVPGDYVPFNVQVLEVAGTPRVFIAYAKSQPDPEDATKFFAAEEDAIAAADETAQPDRGRVASLGDSNALYFAAGPGDETQGLFGALRHLGN